MTSRLFVLKLNNLKKRLSYMVVLIIVILMVPVLKGDVIVMMVLVLKIIVKIYLLQGSMVSIKCSFSI